MMHIVLSNLTIVPLDETTYGSFELFKGTLEECQLFVDNWDGNTQDDDYEGDWFEA
jgi:hypothetical protein